MTTQEWVEKGIALGELGRWEEALKAFNEAIKINPKYAAAWCCKAVVLRRLDRNDEALDAFMEATQINTRLAQVAYNHRALFIQVLAAKGEPGRYGEAIDAFFQAMALGISYRGGVE